MPTYSFIECAMTNDDGAKYGNAYFYWETPEGKEGRLTEQGLSELRNQNGDIWNQVYLVPCADGDEARTKRREFLGE